MARRWSDEDDQLLRRWYAEGVPVREIGARLSRTEDALVARRRTLGVAVRRQRRQWPAKLDELLRASAAAGIPARVVAERLGLPTEAVRWRRRSLVPSRIGPRRYATVDDEAIRAGLKRAATFDELGHRLGRSPAAVRMRARSLGLVAARERRRWTQEEDRLVRAGYASGLTCEAIAAQLLHPRSPSSVSGRARKLGLATYARRWTSADDARLRMISLAGTSVEDAAAQLGRTPEAIRQRARKLGLQSPRPRARWNDGRRWTDAEESVLRRAPGVSPGALALALGRSDLAIRRRQSELNVRENRHRSPHHRPPTGEELTPGEAGVVARELAHPTGRRLLAVARRLERTPGALQRLAVEAMALQQSGEQRAAS